MNTFLKTTLKRIDFNGLTGEQLEQLEHFSDLLVQKVLELKGQDLSDAAVLQFFRKQGPELKLPKGLDQLLILDTENQVITNPISGESCELTPQAAAVYDCIMGFQLTGAIGSPHAKIALEWFVKNYPEEYMILLD